MCKKKEVGMKTITFTFLFFKGPVQRTARICIEVIISENPNYLVAFAEAQMS